MGNFDKKEYMREYRQKNLERLNASHREYYERTKDKWKEYRKEYYQEHCDEIKTKNHEKYLKNKDEILNKCKEYRHNNREKLTKKFLEYRKKKSLELKESGQLYTYLPKTQRENKMVESLAKKLGVGEIIAREILEKYDWNYKKVVSEDD